MRGFRPRRGDGERASPVRELTELRSEHDTPSSAEFSRVVRADAVRAGRETVQRVEADEGERRALARRFDLIDIPRLVAVVRLTRRGETIRVEGEIDADVVQACVATLAPVPARIEEGFVVRLTPEDEGDFVPGSVMDVDLDDEEDEDALIDGRIDIGELTSQYLSLALDPYPRAPGVEFEPHIEHTDDDEGAAAPSPFAVLAKTREPS